MRLGKATAWTSATAGLLLAANMALSPLAYADEGEHRNDEEIVVLEEGSGVGELDEGYTREATMSQMWSYSNMTGQGSGYSLNAAIQQGLRVIALNASLGGSHTITQCGGYNYTYTRSGTGSGANIWYTATVRQNCSVYNALPGQSPVLPASMKV